MTIYQSKTKVSLGCVRVSVVVVGVGSNDGGVRVVLIGGGNDGCVVAMVTMVVGDTFWYQWKALVRV